MVKEFLLDLSFIKYFRKIIWCHVVVPFCAAGSRLQHKVTFGWVNQEDEAEVGLVRACNSMISLLLK